MQVKGFFLGVVTGIALAGAGVAVAQVYAQVNTSGTLKGYVVQKNGKTVCRDPSVYLQFRGPTSYIVCE